MFDNIFYEVAALLHALRNHGYAGRVVLTVHTTRDAEILHCAGANAVLLPFSDGVERTVEVLTTRADRVHRRSAAP